MQQQIRVALLGVEHYHANFWAKALRASDKAVVSGAFDTCEARAADFAEMHALPVAPSLDALLDGCDAVAICSATSEHRPLIEAAASRGRPILCEKPLAVSEAEGREIKAIVERSGVRFMQSFPKRLDPATHAIRDIVASGELGRIALCRVRHGHSHGLRDDFHRAWFVDPAKSGGGTLLDEGIHAADFLRFVFGDAEAVFAVVSDATLGLTVEDTALATFTYPDGMIAEVSTSWCFAAADASIEIYGTCGTVLLSGVDIASRPTRDSGFLQVFRRDGDGGSWTSSDLVPHFKTGVFHEHVAWAFVDALASGGEMPSGLDDGLRALTMIGAAYEAARQGSIQTIAFLGERESSRP